MIEMSGVNSVIAKRSQDPNLLARRLAPRQSTAILHQGRERLEAEPLARNQLEERSAYKSLAVQRRHI